MGAKDLIRFVIKIQQVGNSLTISAGQFLSVTDILDIGNFPLLINPGGDDILKQSWDLHLLIPEKALST